MRYYLLCHNYKIKQSSKNYFSLMTFYIFISTYYIIIQTYTYYFLSHFFLYVSEMSFQIFRRRGCVLYPFTVYGYIHQTQQDFYFVCFCHAVFTFCTASDFPLLKQTSACLRVKCEFTFIKRCHLFISQSMFSVSL